MFGAGDLPCVAKILVTVEGEGHSAFETVIEVCACLRRLVVKLLVVKPTVEPEPEVEFAIIIIVEHSGNGTVGFMTLPEEESLNVVVVERIGLDESGDEWRENLVFDGLSDGGLEKHERGGELATIG